MTAPRRPIHVEVQARLSSLQRDVWPVTVAPQFDELLSSWFMRTAYANGISSRHLAGLVGLTGALWLAKLDTSAPDYVLAGLSRNTGHKVWRLRQMMVVKDAWLPLLLDLPCTDDQIVGSYLQFCPLCLSADERPYFRRHWRLAHNIICRAHRRGLLICCPRCSSGISAAGHRTVLPLHFCAVCSHDLRKAEPNKIPWHAATASRLIDEIFRIEEAKGVLEIGGLTSLISALPKLAGSKDNPPLAKQGLFHRVASLKRARPELDKALSNRDHTGLSKWRCGFIAMDGLDPTLLPLYRILSARVIVDEPDWSDRAPKPSGPMLPPRPRMNLSVTLFELLSAYAAVRKRNMVTEAVPDLSAGPAAP